MRQRLEDLRTEYRRGLRELELLERRRRELDRTLLRIGGAIQVLEELLEEESPGDEAAAAEAGALEALGA